MQKTAWKTIPETSNFWQVAFFGKISKGLIRRHGQNWSIWGWILLIQSRKMLIDVGLLTSLLRKILQLLFHTLFSYFLVLGFTSKRFFSFIFRKTQSTISTGWRIFADTQFIAWLLLILKPGAWSECEVVVADHSLWTAICRHDNYWVSLHNLLWEQETQDQNCFTKETCKQPRSKFRMT